MATNGNVAYTYDSSAGSYQSAGDGLDACETFLESYSRGNIEVGGEEPPELARKDIPLDILLAGDFAAPHPPDDDQRVRELYQFRILKELNHDAKLGLDRFARLATLVCDAKICIINFLDDKTQYTSSEVAPAPFLLHTPLTRPSSMCTHTILKRSPDLFEVPDLKKDWRFRNKPYVAGEPYIRYYVGAPLRTKSGFNIGTLCLLDYVPKQLTPHQRDALKDLANMVITDLELHRDKELVGLKGRMANSITQFTRGLIKREVGIKDKQRAANIPTAGLKVKRGKGPGGWITKTTPTDEEKTSPLAGVMGFYGLETAQKKADASPEKVEEDDSTMVEAESTGDESDTTDSQNLEEIDLKAMYRYACRLMRETLGVEGVCFVDIDGIDWKHALEAPDYRDEKNPDTHTSGQHRREFGSASSILGYSHSAKFGIQQRENWPSIARWDEEAETSNPNQRETSNYNRYDPSETLESSVPSQTGHSTKDASNVSEQMKNQYDDGGFSNHFLAKYLHDYPFGKIFNDGLPDDLQDFLPKGVVSAILVPIYDFDHHPFAMTCAYSSSKQKKFSEEEKRYLEGFGSQILSQVLKKRIIMADRAKGIFISNISHELRSPLHGILASAEFLADTRLDTLQRTFIDTIDSCGRTLLDVINHVLDFGKLTYIARLKNKVSRPHLERSASKETIPQQIDVTSTDLMTITEQVVESCYAGYEFKGLFGQVDIGSILDESSRVNERRNRGRGYGRAKDPTSALTLIIDVEYREQGWFFVLQSGAVQRILMNITGNALKYTESGWVRVQLCAKDTDDGQTTVHLTVSDSGKGISSEFLRTRLFSPFSQEDTLQTGTGLGMSIVKQVVDRLGGQINVTSQIGMGTNVHVSLPGTPVSRETAIDSCTQVRARTRGMKAFLAGFDKKVTASRLLYESMATYLTKWYNIELVDDVYSSDFIISDECPELLDYFQQTSPGDRSAFSPPFFSPTTPESATSHSVYRAWQPLIVLCSNALRYEFYGQQAESGKIIDFSSKPCGPYKLARSILFCLEQAETRKQSLEGMMESTRITSPRIPSRLESIASNVDSFSSEPMIPPPRRGSFGRGVVRFSPSIRRGSSDNGASMYVAGRGFVPTSTSSIVEPQRFVGMRRKSGISSTQTTPNSEDLLTFDTEERFQNSEEPVVFKMPTMSQTSSSSESFHPPQSPTSPYTRRNPPRSVAIPPAMKDLHHRPKETLPPKTTKDPSKPRPPNVLIVEDNSVNSLILATFLRKRGYPFIQAENGLLAVQAVQARPEGFDVILMDIQMPVMDGSAATAAIRSLEKARSCRPSYIVALTGLAAEKDRQLAFASGVDHFLTKPVSLKQLGVVIDDWERRDVERGSMKSDFLQNSMEIRG